ncbi:hypothetical protein BD779DRAFT_1469129 [Infundibulicybe gibba]|nr:hypothetical protein BD779DRAFT_1469129 [Infundibulicybe gibba]
MEWLTITSSESSAAVIVNNLLVSVLAQGAFAGNDIGAGPSSQPACKSPNINKVIKRSTWDVERDPHGYWPTAQTQFNKKRARELESEQPISTDVETPAGPAPKRRRLSEDLMYRALENEIIKRCLDDLPVELLTTIMNNTPDDSLVALSRTNQQLRRVPSYVLLKRHKILVPDQPYTTIYIRGVEEFRHCPLVNNGRTMKYNDCVAHRLGDAAKWSRGYPLRFIWHTRLLVAPSRVALSAIDLNLGVNLIVPVAQRNGTSHSDEMASTSIDEQHPNKRRRIADPSVAHFIDLEAEVDDDDEDEDEEDEGDLIDDEGPTAGDSISSHAEVSRQLIHLQDDSRWEDLLRRAQKRSETVEAPPDGTFEPLPSDYPLWEIPVTPGYEETSVFKIFQKLLDPALASKAMVRSSFGRATLPGRIFVEAAGSRQAREITDAMNNVYPLKIRAVPAEEAAGYLNEGNTYSPAKPGWVRMSRGRYRGDIGLIHNIHRSLLIDIIVVPRFTYTPRGKTKGSSRPPPARFDLDLAIRTGTSKYLRETVEGQKFRGVTYRRDGYLLLKAVEGAEYMWEEATPSHEELMRFLECEEAAGAAREIAVTKHSTMSLKAGERVRIDSGNLRGQLALIEDLRFNNQEADIYLITQNLLITVPSSSLRKHFRIGDEVRVMAGPHHGFSGWVIDVLMEELTIISHDPAQRDIEVTVGTGIVEFHSPAISTTGPPPIRSHSTQGMSDPADRRYIGRRVRIIGSNNFKSYDGLIKGSFSDGTFSVELQANMTRQRFNLRNLAFINQQQLAPLPSAPMWIMPTSAYSERPLAPSTPLPTPSTSQTSPAWDPSSRTPSGQDWLDTTAGKRSNLKIAVRWLSESAFVGKRVRLRIVGTKPVLRDPGFMSGNLERRIVEFVKVQGETVEVIAGANGKIFVPFKYLERIEPTTKGDIVTATRGEHAGQEFRISAFGADICAVGSRKKSSGKNKPFDIATDILAIIS